MLKFLVDESAGKKLFNFLKKLGYDTCFVTDVLPGASDTEVLSLAEKENRVLITNDKDFGEIIFRANMPSSGVILLRLRDDFPENRQTYVSAVLEHFSDKIKYHFIVVTEGKIRLRKM